ncbi:MAG: hypothetical protein RLZZ543_1438 [Bacteroidota bacterium]|jgi:predicted O-methyltransferase YrrM
MAAITRKFSKLLRGLSLLMKQPALLNTLIDQEEVHEQIVRNQLGLKDGFPEADYFELFSEEKEEVVPFAFLDGGSLPTDLALLKILAKKIQAKTYFEIGTWRGESVSNVATEVEQCYTLNLSSDQMRARNWADDYIALHGHYSKKFSNIQHLFGDSREFDFSPYEGKMDLVFVDGDHHYDSVVEDTRTAFKLIRPGGIIVWHDYGHSPEQIRWNVAHAIFEGTPAEKRKDLLAISNSLCAAYLPMNVSRRVRHYPRKPENSFHITLSSVRS